MENFFNYGKKETDHLKKVDKLLGAAIEKIGHISRSTNPDTFAALIQSIISQQISTKAAQTVQKRLAALCLNSTTPSISSKSSTPSESCESSSSSIYSKSFASSTSPLSPERLAALSIEQIQSTGMSMRKASYISQATQAALSGHIDFAAISTLSDQEIISSLTSLPGVGIWTAQMLLIFSLQRPNIVSYEDLAIRRGMKNLYNLNALTKKEFEKYAAAYTPYGSVASLYLWEVS